VKDTADVDRLVEDVMSQTDYPDPVFVKDTLLEFNFDMAATVDFILSMSIVMSNQQEDETVSKCRPGSAERNIKNEPSNASSEIRTSQALFSVKKQVTDMDEQCEDVGESEGSSSGRADDSDENPSSPVPEADSSQIKPSSSRKEVRVNGRKKKELKKRERKREAEIRKKRTTSNDGEQSKDNVVVVSNFGSLDI
jgi:hypothetical protein